MALESTHFLDDLDTDPMASTAIQTAETIRQQAHIANGGEATFACPKCNGTGTYGRFGRCSCCGRDLVDPVSIRAGIGPICAERWGLDYRRELAAQELAGEA